MKAIMARNQDGDVIVYPLGGRKAPRHEEMLAPTSALIARPGDRSASSRRPLSGAPGAWSVGHVAPEAYVADDPRLVKEGDSITIDARSGSSR